MFETLFSPIKIGELTIKNRINMSPMSNYMSTPAGEFSDREISFYAERAKGGAGMITIGAAFVNPGGSFGVGQLGIHDDSRIPYFQKLVKTIHGYDTKLSIQLHHAGRQTSAAVYGYQPVAPSAVACPVKQEVPRALTIAEIEQLIEDYGQGARRAKEAGSDAIEIHGAHGYLPCQFLSPYSNKRTDEYGGDINNRTRFLRQIIARCRQVVGDSFPITVRLVGDEFVEEGIHLEEAQRIARIVELAGANAISISAHVAPFYRTVPNMAFQPGTWVYLAEGIKKVVNIPVMAVGRINSPALAEEILSSGKADIVNIGRPLIADPEFPVKAQSNNAADIRTCIGCNKGCHDRKRKEKSTACLMNPAAGREYLGKDAPAERIKKVLIVGGGPAGMEAAIVSASRGHKVTLFEADPELGGRLILAGIPPQKQGYQDAVAYFRRQITQLPITVSTGTVVTPELLKQENPDVVIIATGSIPVFPPIPGLDSQNAVTADQILAGTVFPGEDVIIIGGGAVGAETAHFLGVKGKRVTLVEMFADIAMEVPDDARSHLLEGLRKVDVTILTETAVLSIGDKVAVKKKDDCFNLEGFDQIIVASGAEANTDLVEEAKKIVSEVYVIGDAFKPKDALQAIHQAWEVARDL